MNLTCSCECLSDIYDIVVDACAKTSCAEGKTISLGFVEIEICIDRLLAVNDLREVEQRHRRIIGMYCKIDVDLFCNGYDRIEEILDVLEVLLRSHALIELDVLSHLAESLRFPSRKTEIT